MWKKFVKGVTWGLAGVAFGAIFGLIASLLFVGALGPDNALVLPVVFGIVCGISGASFGISSVKERRNRRRRSGRSRRSSHNEMSPLTPFNSSGEHPDVSSHILEVQPLTIASEPISLENGHPSVNASSARLTKDFAQFETATGASANEVQRIRVCDVRLDEDGLPISIHLPSDAQAPGRDIFLVLDNHRLTVARILENAMRREPGNTKAKLFH